MSPVELVRKFRLRTAGERLLLVEALLWLGIMRLAVLLTTFQRVVNRLGLTAAATPIQPTPEQMSCAARVGWAVRSVATLAPWAGTCLTQALAGSAMLLRRKAPFLLILGVAREGSDLAAHAWLKCGNDILTGEGGHDRYAVISSFSPERLQ